MTPLPAALKLVADRVYQRDPARFRRLIVWIADARKRNWTDDRIRRALLALDNREAEGAQIAEWWPWLEEALRKVRTLDLEKENEGYKHGDANTIRAVLAKIYAESKRG